MYTGYSDPQAGSGRWPIGCGPRTEGCYGRSIALANGNVCLDGKRRSEQGRSTFNPCRFAWTRQAKRRGLSTSGSLTTSRADFHKLLTSTTSCYMHRVPERCLSIRIIDDCLPSEWICTCPDAHACECTCLHSTNSVTQQRCMDAQVTLPLPHLSLVAPPHLRRDLEIRPFHISTGTGLASPTPAPGLNGLTP